VNQKTLVVRPEQPLAAVPAELADLAPIIRKDGRIAITYKLGEQLDRNTLAETPAPRRMSGSVTSRRKSRTWKTCSCR